MGLQYEDLVITNDKQDKNEIYTLFEEPTDEPTSKGGLFFALIDISISPEMNARIVNIFDEIKQKYFKQFKDLTSDETLDVADTLEQILADTNHKLAGVIEANLKTFDIRDLNFVVGVLKNKTLILSQLGRTRAFLLHQISEQKKGTDTKNKRYKVMDILEDSEGTPDVSDTLKIFSNIISGSINKNDSLVLCNESFTDYLSLDKIKKTVTTLPTKSAAELFKNTLNEVDAPVNFACLLIKSQGAKIEEPVSIEEKVAIAVAQKPDSHKSVERLIETEQTTARLLTPSIKPNIKKAAGAIAGVLKKATTKPKGQRSYSPKATASPYSRRRKSSIAKLFSTIFDSIGQIFSAGGKIFGYFAPSSKKNIATSKTSENLGVGHQKISKERPIHGTNWFNRLPYSSKILLILALVLLALFLLSLKFLSYKTEREQEIGLYNQKLQEIESTINSIEASFYYKDEEGAQEKVMRLEEMLSSLPANTKERRAEIAALRKELNSQAFKLKHIEEIADPVIIFNYSTLDQTVKLGDLTFVNNQIYTFNPDNNVIYQLDPNDKTSKTIDKSSFKLGNLAGSLAYGDDAIIYVLNNQQLAKFSLTQESIQLTDIALNDAEKQAGKAASYFNNLYFLAPDDNQIYKHSSTGTGFGSGKAWLKVDLDLSQAKHLTIDGLIYVLTSDGKVYKLLRGEPQAFDAPELDPALSNPTKIITTAEQSNLYIVDPNEKRIVVLEKENGRLVNQYYSQKFDDLKDIIVDERAGSMHVLNGQILYGIALKKQ